MASKKKATSKKTSAAKTGAEPKKARTKTKSGSSSRAKSGVSDPPEAVAGEGEFQASSTIRPAKRSPVEHPSDDDQVRQSPLTAEELKEFEKLLLNLRDQVVDEISSLTADNLSGKTFSRTGEEGTDNFNREFALKLVSSEQDIIYEIDEALRRIASGTYGLCEYSGEPIEKERLRVMPHARHCVSVQSEMERGRIKYRPFAPPSVRGE